MEHLFQKKYGCLNQFLPADISVGGKQLTTFGLTINMTKDLQLIWTKHPYKEYSERQYFDYLTSGQLLREYLGIKSILSVTPFGFFPSKEEQNRILKEFKLQQKTQLIEDRIELYICECCGDISCGAVTVKIIDRGDKIIWTHFAKQSDRDEIGEEIQVDQIEFDRQSYFKAFSNII